jgi:putative two-component system response regulator
MLECDSLRVNPVVLVVDDDELIRCLAREALEQVGIIVEEAEDGTQALSLFERCRPDLVLLDVTMPDMDGYQVCERLKSSGGAENVPVIFLTGRSQLDDEAKGFELGAVDYIGKPFNPITLKARVQTHLQLKRQKDVLKSLVNTLAEELRQDQRDCLQVLGIDGT